jgi:thymidylate synthase ThyX
MEFDNNIKARLVYDGKTLTIPSEMIPHKDGTIMTEESFSQLIKSKNQLQGSDRERLCELAGRVCYDSLGQGRDSAKYWEHIRQVGHLSVIEHAYFTVEFDMLMADAASLLNRRGIWVNILSFDAPFKPNRLRLTFNLRTLMEWHRWTARSDFPVDFQITADTLYEGLYAAIQPHVSLILPARKVQQNQGATDVCRVEPRDNNERTISLFLAGSRGFSHEQVRHRENMSQRSTRYVDEDGSPWVEHPNTTMALHELNTQQAESMTAKETLFQLYKAQADCINASRHAYKTFAAYLEHRAITRGIDKQTARKQARGAARGFLGNALYTELIFTTSVDGWKDIIRLRLNDAADAEIRVCYGKVLAELKKSQYGSEFNCFELVPASDGLGFAVKETK